MHDSVGTARGDPLREDLHDLRKVLRVNDVARRPLPQLLESPSGVFEYLAIAEFELATRRHERDQAWNAVHQPARVARAFVQETCLLQADRGLVRGNIEKHSFRVGRKVDPRRSSKDDADLALKPQTGGHDGHLSIADQHPCARRSARRSMT